MKTYLNAPQVAKLFGVNIQTVRAYIRSGELPAAKVGRRYVVSGDRPAPSVHDVDRDPTPMSLFLAVESSFAWTREPSIW